MDKFYKVGKSGTLMLNFPNPDTQTPQTNLKLQPGFTPTLIL